MIDALGKTMASMTMCAIIMTFVLMVFKLFGQDISLLTIFMPLIVTAGTFIVICVVIFTFSILKSIFETIFRRH